MKTGNGSAVQVLPAVTDYYVHYRVSLMAALEAVEITDRDRKPIETEKAFARLDELSRSIKASGRTQFLCGNGASASFANHMALATLRGQPINGNWKLKVSDVVGQDVGKLNKWSLKISS